MMKTIAFILLLLCNIGFTQRQLKIDSLKKALAIEKQDTSRVFTMCRLASIYHQINIDSAFYYSQRALALARQIKYPKGEAEALDQLAYTFYLSGNPAKAAETFLSCLKIAEKNNVPLRKASSLFILGIIFREDLNDTTKALNYIYKAKALFNAIHQNKFSVASTIEKKYAAALFTACEYRIASIYTDLNQLDSAQYYLQLAYQHVNQFDFENYVRPRVLDNLGLFYKAKGENENALYYLKQGLAQTYNNEDFGISSVLNYHIAKIYQQENKLDSAIYFAQNGLTDAQKGNLFKNQIAAGAILSDLYKYKDIGKALEYNELASAAKDSLYSLREKYALINVLDFDEQERQYEIETAQTAYKNQVRQNVLFAGLGVILLIAFILYRNSRQKQKAKIKIEKAYQELQTTQDQLVQREKMASLGELTSGIAHEIKNPLNFINNFCELNMELITEIEEQQIPNPDKENQDQLNSLINTLKNNSAKINQHGKRIDGIVKGMLQHSQTGSITKEAVNINSLCDESLRLAYHGFRAKEKNFSASFETRFDPDLPDTMVIPQDLGRVMINLINNAFYTVNEKKKKYQSDESPDTPEMESLYKPSVVVSTKKIENKICITVSDNGMGIPTRINNKIFQPFFTTKPTGEGTGLGLSMSYDIIVKSHGGELRAKSNEGLGTDFEIVLPV